jgi:mannose-6-phosphate isomerase-like protein (cupin superfamily)
MDHYLIDKLWNHTYQAYEESMKREANSTTTEEMKQINSKRPNLLTASMFFYDDSTLFMSFHPEDTNSNQHCHDFFEMIYVCKGNPISVINDQEIPFQEGNLCIMNPNAVHYFKKYSLQTDLVMNILLPKDLFQKSIFQTYLMIQY